MENDSNDWRSLSTYCRLEQYEIATTGSYFIYKNGDCIWFNSAQASTLSVLLQSAQHSIDIVIIIIISFYRGESWNTKKWRHAFLNLLQNQQVPKDARADAQEQGDTPLESSDAGGTQIQGKGWQRKSQPSKERGVLSEQQKDTKTCWCLLLEEGATEDHFDMVSFSFCSGWRRKWAKSLPGRQVLASHAEQQWGWKPGERKSSERMTEWERVNTGK